MLLSKPVGIYRQSSRGPSSSSGNWKYVEARKTTGQSILIMIFHVVCVDFSWFMSNLLNFCCELTSLHVMVSISVAVSLMETLKIAASLRLSSRFSIASNTLHIVSTSS